MGRTEDVARQGPNRVEGAPQALAQGRVGRVAIAVGRDGIQPGGEDDVLAQAARARPPGPARAARRVTRRSARRDGHLTECQGFAVPDASHTGDGRYRGQFAVLGIVIGAPPLQQALNRLAPGDDLRPAVARQGRSAAGVIPVRGGAGSCPVKERVQSMRT